MATTTERLFGKSIKRREDPRFITGRGQYVDDLKLPGMIMAAHQILERYPKPSEDQIRHQLEGNLCRCTGYHNIVKAIQWASEQMAGQK